MNDKDFQELKGQVDRLVDLVEANIREIEELKTETRSAVELTRDLQGAARIGVRVQKFVRWLVGVPLVGVGAYNIIMWGVELVSKPTP